MINQQKKILLLTAISLAVVKVNGIDGIARALHHAPKTFFLTTSNSNFTSSSIYAQAQVYAQAQGTCQQLGQDYEEVYAFLTHNFYINICRQGDSFYYYRQSKSNPEQSIVLKATAVRGGKVFKAVKGKMTYFVGVNANGYYSSVMQPNNEIVVEPEVKPETLNVNI